MMWNDLDSSFHIIVIERIAEMMRGNGEESEDSDQESIDLEDVLEASDHNSETEEEVDPYEFEDEGDAIYCQCHLIK